MSDASQRISSPDDDLDKVVSLVTAASGECPAWCRAMAITMLDYGLKIEKVSELIINAMQHLRRLEGQAATVIMRDE